MAVVSTDMFDNVSLWMVAETVCVALLVLVLFKVVAFWMYVRKMEGIFKDAPGPPKYHWLFGHIYHFPKDGQERIDHFINFCNEYGDKGYVFIWTAFRVPVIVPTCPRTMALICKSTEPKFLGTASGYRMIRPWLGDGLLIASGEKWARNRRLLTPAFHFDILKPYMKVYNDSAEKLVKKWSTHVDAGERFEVFQNVLLCTLEVILKCAFSFDDDVQTVGATSPYVQAVKGIIEGIYVRFVHPWLLVDFIYWFSKAGRQNRKDLKYVLGVADEVIAHRRKTLEKEGVPSGKRHLDFLDILLQARDENGQGMTTLDIRNEVNTFLFEGHDTTGSAISWILYSLAENPECQQRCQEEVDEVLNAKATEDIELSDFTKFEYLTMCIKEGMRVHSPVPVLSRHTTKEFDIGERTLPPGVLYMINVMVLNHMESIWGKDHMEFKPERFTKDNISRMDPFQYVPFSAGPRNCIGQNFAMNEEKVILAKLLRNFTFRLDPNHTVKKTMTAITRPQDGIYMFAEKRQIVQK